jgi:hypothetical protein
MASADLINALIRFVLSNYPLTAVADAFHDFATRIDGTETAWPGSANDQRSGRASDEALFRRPDL